MEEKINIAEILKDKPKGIRLYSPIFGDCSFLRIQNETDEICVKKHNNLMDLFSSKGLYNILGECLLFPSKEMRDWRKFAWKKGDVLISNDYNTEVIFYNWYDDTYTDFYGKHRLDSEDKNNIKYNDAFLCTTGRYSLEDKDAAQTYIKDIEERLGGKLNRETLEVEKTQPEFKDGDVLFVKCEERDFIEIFNYSKKNGDLYDHASLDSSTHNLDISGKYRICKDEITEIRLATDSEKQQLFSALEKEGKTWNAEKKQIVDLKPKVDELKPFDKVLVKDSPYRSWEPALFWKKVDVKDLHPYKIIGGKRYRFCEPYEGNEHLLDN